MDFTITHVFHAPAEEVAGVILNQDYQASLHDVGALKSRELLEQKDADGGVVRRIRCVPQVQVSGPARRFLGESEPAWVEEARWDAATKRWRWVVKPEVAAHLLSSEGSIELHEADGKTTRRVTGFVKVAVPLYGRRVEQWIVAGLERSYDEEAERLAAWLEREKGEAR